MPTYCYRVRGTNDLVEHFVQSHKDRTETITTNDGKIADFDLMATIQGVRAVPLGAYPVKSRSMGVMPSQLAEARRRFPTHRFDKDGRRIIGSPGEKNRILADLNRNAVPGHEIVDLN